MKRNFTAIVVNFQGLFSRHIFKAFGTAVSKTIREMFAFNVVLNIGLGTVRKGKANSTSWPFELILNNVSLKVFWC